MEDQLNVKFFTYKYTMGTNEDGFIEEETKQTPMGVRCKKTILSKQY
jgi:hypothetical protein